MDWLIGEAMKRLLETGPGAKPMGGASPPVASSRGVGRPLPLPPPRSPGIRLALRLDGKTLKFDAGRQALVIGRSSRDAQIVLRDPNVSRQHAMVERNAKTGGLTVIDMASTNGVLVNGRRVPRATLRAGDRIEIGPFTIEVVLQERGH